MNSSSLAKSDFTPRFLSWGAQIGGMIILTGWLVFVILELFKNHFQVPDKEAVYQGIVLMVVFAGYVLIPKHALAGSLLVIIGMVCFFPIVFATSGVWPEISVLWFILPAILSLAAWCYTRRRSVLPGQNL